MRDPMTWALPLYRLFGIQVKVHLLFFLVTLPMFLRLQAQYEGTVGTFDLFMMTVGLVFLIVLFHEYGHCFAARRVGGEADQILLWPLGGLAFVQVPHTPRANFITTAAGPGANVVLCVACAILLGAGGFSPLAAFNPLNNPFKAPIYNVRDGRTYTGPYDAHFYKAGTNDEVKPGAVGREPAFDNPFDKSFEVIERAAAPTWVVWAWRVCWLSWWMFLFNMLIPAYPMDCGRLIHCVLWARTDYRTATITSCYIGYGAALVMFMISVFYNEVMLVSIAFFILINCFRTLAAESDGDAGAFGYDFSQGYTSLEKDDPPARGRKNAGPVKRWLQARRARRLQQEVAERQQDDARMDSLLEKIARSGKATLTDEEQRFMERVSQRYRNRS